MAQVDFGAYKEEDNVIVSSSSVMVESNESNQVNNKLIINDNDNSEQLQELVISEEQCTEIACFAMTYTQCEHCRNYKCDNHLHRLCMFGPYCQYCHKRKMYIVIGSIICVLIVLALIFWSLHLAGVYS